MRYQDFLSPIIFGWLIGGQEAERCPSIDLGRGDYLSASGGVELSAVG